MALRTGLRRNRTWVALAVLASTLDVGCGAEVKAASRDATTVVVAAESPPAQPSSASPSPVVAMPAAAPAFAPVDAKQAPAPPPPPPSPGTAPAQPKVGNEGPHSAAMLIYTANLSMAVFQVAQGIEAVEGIGQKAGGYLSTRSDNAVTIRVPRDKFQDSLAQIEKIGDVTQRDIKAEDVTDEFVDLSARLKNAYAMRDRLTDLLQKAPVKEAIEIQKELGHVTEDIERMEGRLKLLKDQIAFSTITVSFSPFADETFHDTTLVSPFPWLEKLGLQSLLQVHQ
jgi:hypothetical protein